MTRRHAFHPYDLVGRGVEQGAQRGLDAAAVVAGQRGEDVIRKIKRESKSGCRVYRKVEDLPRVLNGLGIAIVSTSQGILSDSECRKKKVGGELLATVY